MPSPLRRSEKANNCLTMASSGSIDSMGSLVAKQKVKKEKSVTQLTYEAKKIDETEHDVDAAQVSRNLRDARVFRAMFQKKKANINVPDRPEERDRRDNFSQKAQPSHRWPGEGVDNCSPINQEALKEHYSDKASGRVLVGESSGCSGLLNGHLENDSGVEHTSQLDNNGSNVKEASNPKGPNSCLLVSDKTTMEVIRTDIHLAESSKELFISDVGKIYQSRHIYDCHHQRGECKDGDGMEVIHSVKCPSALPNGILEKEGGVVMQREQLSRHIDQNLQTSIVRNSILEEESLIDCDVHERCESSPSLKRKRNLVHVDDDMSTRISNDDTVDVIGSGISSLDKCYKPVRESETCLKRKRVENNPIKQGVRTCDTKVAQESFEWKNTKGKDEAQGTTNNGHPEKTNSVQQKAPSVHLEANDHKKMCLTCGLGGKLLYCDGKGCNQVYHISCLEPPMVYLPFGGWHCSFCVRKKVEAGVYAISEGLDSIWDAREVSDVDGMKTEKQYLVKYKGVAHVHNRWVEESQLVQEAPSLLMNFHKAKKVARWNSDWSIPHHLLCKRDLMVTSNDDDCRNNDELNCHHEWLVKWCGLGYEHATWELDNAPFLCSPEGQCRIRDYEERYQRAKRIGTHSRDDMISVQDLPIGSFPGFDDNHLDAVNKLRQHWHKNLNAVIFDDQDRVKKTVAFILSLKSDVSRPFLIISTCASLLVWEKEFFHLDPSVVVVTFNGNHEVLKGIEELEFYGEGGCILFRVLITTPEIVKDQEALLGIDWEIVVVDECQCSEISSHFDEIKMLTAHMRLLTCGQLKDSMDECVHLLSLLDSHDDINKTNGLSLNPSDGIYQLKERLSRYIAYVVKSDSSRFVEYWVPVQISDIQLEQYCATLLMNSFSLLSFSKSDAVWALRDLLISSRKCCDHPYVIEESLQSILTEGRRADEYLDIGIKASGKLQLLDKMLLNIKKLGLRAIILFQSIGSGKNSLGDMLEDYLQQRFGRDSYERVDEGALHSKKLAAPKMLDNKDSGRFMFLLEKSACHPSIKLPSVDVVVLFNSDWNPLSDIMQLQKISLDPCDKKIKIFRFYSAFTVEEKVLILAKNDKALDSQLQSPNRCTFHSLLMWGVSCLLEELKVLHDGNARFISERMLSEQSILSELTSILRQSNGNNYGSVLSKIIEIRQHDGTYRTDHSLLGEQKIQVIGEGPPHLFWKNLLERKNPVWKYTSISSHKRNRKQIQQLDCSAKRYDIDFDEIQKKQKILVDSNIDLSVKSGNEGKVSLGKNEDIKGGGIDNFAGVAEIKMNDVPLSLPSAIAAINDPVQANFFPESPTLSGRIRKPPEVDMTDLNKAREYQDSKKNFYHLLKPDITKLCDILHLPDNVRSVADKFLEYVMNNHHVNTEKLSRFQAFQLSVCWTAASFLKLKVVRKESLILAKQHLNFECTKDETDFVYSKMQCLKTQFLVHSRNFIDALQISDVSSGMYSLNPNAKGIRYDLNDDATTEECSEIHLHHTLGLTPEVELTLQDLSKSIKDIHKKCQKKMEKLIERQNAEICEFERLSFGKMAELENKYKIEYAVIRSYIPNAAARADKLKFLENDCSREKEKFRRQNEMRLKDLRASHMAARQKLQGWEESWVKEVKTWARSELLNVAPLEESGSGIKYLKKSEDIQALERSNPHLSEHSEDRGGQTIVPERQESVPRLPEIIGTSSSGGALGCSDSIGMESHGDKQKNDIDKSNTVASEICENQLIVVSTISSSRSQDTAGVRVIMSDKEIVPLDAVENFSSNDMLSSKEQICTQNRDDAFQASESSSRHVKHTHPTSRSPCAEGILFDTKSSVIHEDLSLGITKTPHLSTSAEHISSVNVKPNEEIIPCAVSRTTGADALPVPFTVSSDDAEKQIPDEIGLTLPNAELGRIGYDSSSCSCLNNSMAVDQTSSEERIADGASVSVSDKEEPIMRNAMVGSVDDPETAVPVVLPLSEQASEGATISLSEVQVPDRTAETVSNEFVRCSNIKENADMIVKSLNNASLADQHGDSCRTICENAYSPELPLPGSLSRQPLETSSGNAVVYLNKTLQAEGTSSTFNRMRCVDATVGEKQSQLVERPYPANDTAPSERMNGQEVAEINRFSLEKSLSYRLEPFHLLAGSGSQHYLCSTEIVSHNFMQPMVQTIENAPERSNLVPTEPASNPEPSPLSNPTVTGLATVLSEARSTFSTSDNNRPLQSALQMVSRIPPPSHTDPLQNELERIKKEMEQTTKNHEDMKLRLKSDCEKEIEEVITQIRRKYDAKFQEIGVDYLNKKTALDTSQNAVLMHKILAEAFRSKCMDLKLPRAPGIQQDASLTQQQLAQLSRLQIAHRPPMVVATPSSSVPPAPCPQNMMNAINLQSVLPTVQAPHNPTVYSNISTRPQVSSIPLPPTVNIQAVCEIRAPAPHLQPYRPSSSLVTTNLSILTHGISNQQVPSNNVVAAASIPQLPTCTPASNYQSGPQNRPPWAELAGGISCPNSSLSALELLMDVDNGSGTVMPENLAPNFAPTAGTSEIVYLSDDD